VPSPDHVLCRFQIVCHGPNRAGTSRHGEPVRYFQMIPSITLRLFAVLAAALPRRHRQPWLQPDPGRVADHIHVIHEGQSTSRGYEVSATTSSGDTA
jgi:hypothetical protein